MTGKMKCTGLSYAYKNKHNLEGKNFVNLCV